MSKNVRLLKDDVIKEVCWDTGASRYYVERILNSILKNITKEVANGNSVMLKGFGTFERKGRAARTGRNPHTNEPVPIPARFVPNFKPAQNFKELVTK